MGQKSGIHHVIHVVNGHTKVVIPDASKPNDACKPTVHKKAK